MNALLAVIFASGIVLSLSACKKGPSWKTETYEEHSVKPQSGEVKIPASLWSRMTALTVKKDAPVKKEKSGEGPEAARPETTFEPLKVYLIEKNKGILNGRNVALSFAPGGGDLDLHDYVLPKRGSFHLAFEFLPAVEKADVRVFFLSNSVIRKIGDETVGSGCDQYFDLTNTVAKAMKGDGFLLNASDQRHVSALAGTYVFASTYDGKLHLASLIIHDDEHRSLECRH